MVIRNISEYVPSKTTENIYLIFPNTFLQKPRKIYFNSLLKRKFFPKRRPNKILGPKENTRIQMARSHHKPFHLIPTSPIKAAILTLTYLTTVPPVYRLILTTLDGEQRWRSVSISSVKP